MDNPIDLFARARIIESRAAESDEENGRFEFQTESSNNGLDFYRTHMNQQTLKNFANDGAAGVQLLDSHNARNLGYGRTFGGRFEIVPGLTPDFTTFLKAKRGGDGRTVELAFDPPTEYMRVIIDTFTVRGIAFGAGLTYASTDDFIRAAVAKMVEDISVGFGEGYYICDICGNNYLDYRACNHLSGMVYPVGEQGDRLLLATVEVDNAHLFEQSVVYDGATPNAMIRKAEELTRSGEVDPDRKALFEARYRVHLPEIPRIYGGISVRTAPTAENPNNGGNSMSFLDEVRDLLGSTAEEADLLAEIRAKMERIAELEPQAKDGRSYRSDLIGLAIAEGIRAHGENFDEETYRSMLETSNIEFIERMTADFRALADATLPSGRQTHEDGDPPAKREVRETAVPDALFIS